MNERELLRNYARQPINLLAVDEETQKLTVTTGWVGEVIGKTFDALQNLLTEVESEEETGGTVLAIDDIRAVLRRALE